MAKTKGSNVQQQQEQLPTQLVISRTFKSQNGEQNQTDEEVVAVHVFQTASAKVRVSMGLTVNLGNFESARCEVGVEIPCYREEIDDATHFARDYCEARLQQEVQAVQAKKADATKPII